MLSQHPFSRRRLLFLSSEKPEPTKQEVQQAVPFKSFHQRVSPFDESHNSNPIQLKSTRVSPNTIIDHKNTTMTTSLAMLVNRSQQFYLRRVGVLASRRIHQRTTTRPFSLQYRTPMVRMVLRIDSEIHNIFPEWVLIQSFLIILRDDRNTNTNTITMDTTNNSKPI